MTNEIQTLALSDEVDLSAWPVVPGPGWLLEIRRRAAGHFKKLGLPTTRHEDWRLTSVAPIGEMTYHRLTDEADSKVTPEIIDRLEYTGLECDTIVFVNGRFQPDMSNLDKLPDGVVVESLAEAIASKEEHLRAHLGHYLETENDAFAAMNTAAFDDGIFIYVPEHSNPDRPIHVLNITATAGKRPVVSFPRNLIVIDNDSEATVIEDYVSTDEQGNATYFTNAVTEIYVGARSKVHHYFTERESRGAYNISTLRVHQEDESDFESHSALLGAGLVRNNVLPRLAGKNCHSLLNGIYIGDGNQKIDNFMRVEHDNVNSNSRQFYKGILSDKAQAAFSGRIIVARGAQKTDAVQSNQNLLLSDDARAHSKPQLEIYADDVKCTHGATAGELDDEAMFYLMTRGLNESAAKSLLVHAFAMESLERMSLEPVRNTLESILIERMPEGNTLRKIL